MTIICLRNVAIRVSRRRYRLFARAEASHSKSVNAVSLMTLFWTKNVRYIWTIGDENSSNDSSSDVSWVIVAKHFSKNRFDVEIRWEQPIKCSNITKRSNQFENPHPIYRPVSCLSFVVQQRIHATGIIYASKDCVIPCRRGKAQKTDREVSDYVSRSRRVVQWRNSSGNGRQFHVCWTLMYGNKYWNRPFSSCQVGWSWLLVAEACLFLQSLKISTNLKLESLRRGAPINID